MSGSTRSKVLVTGATGNVGAHVVSELRARSASVRAFVRNADAATAKLGDVELAVGDLADQASVERALVGVQRVFLCAADGPDKVAHERAVIDAAAAAGVDHIVKLSAMHAGTGSPLPAFRWHGEIEAHLRRSGVPATVLAPSFFMANLLMVAGGVAHTGTLFASTAGAKVAMIDLRDVAACAAVALTTEGHEGGTYELTGPRAITFDEVAMALGDATGRRVEYVDLTPEESLPRFEAAGLPDWLFDHLTRVFELIREGGFAQTTGAVHAITGHEPRSIADFARDHAVAFLP